jgi:hypothetical protein
MLKTLKNELLLQVQDRLQFINNHPEAIRLLLYEKHDSITSLYNCMVRYSRTKGLKGFYAAPLLVMKEIYEEFNTRWHKYSNSSSLAPELLLQDARKRARETAKQLSTRIIDAALQQLAVKPLLQFGQDKKEHCCFHWLLYIETYMKECVQLVQEDKRVKDPGGNRADEQLQMLLLTLSYNTKGALDYFTSHITGQQEAASSLADRKKICQEWLQKLEKAAHLEYDPAWENLGGIDFEGYCCKYDTSAPCIRTCLKEWLMNELQRIESEHIESESAAGKKNDDHIDWAPSVALLGVIILMFKEIGVIVNINMSSCIRAIYSILRKKGLKPNLSSLEQGYKQVDPATRKQLKILVDKMKIWVDNLP